MLKLFLIIQLFYKCLSYTISVDNALSSDDPSKNIYKDLNTAFKSFSGCTNPQPVDIEIYLYGNTKVYALSEAHLLCAKKVKVLSGTPSVLPDFSLESQGKILLGNGSALNFINIRMKMSEFKTTSFGFESSREYFPSSFSLTNVEITGTLGATLGSLINLNNVPSILIQSTTFNSLTRAKSDSVSTFSFLIVTNSSNITFSDSKMISCKMTSFNLLSAVSSDVSFVSAVFKSNEFRNSENLGLIAVSNNLQVTKTSVELNYLDNVTIFTSLSQMTEVAISFSDFKNNTFASNGISVANVAVSLRLRVTDCSFWKNFVAGSLMTFHGSDTLQAEFLRNTVENNSCFRFFSLTEATKLSITDFAAKNHNKNEDPLPSNFLGSGALFYLDSVEEITISKLKVESSKSTKEAGGLLIITTLGIVTQSVKISEASFIENIMSSAENVILYPGYALYSSSAVSVEFENSIFKSNTAHQPGLALGGPCAFIDNQKGDIYFRSSSFISNQAFKSSNVFEFFGHTISISQSSFQKNINSLNSYANYGVGVLNFQGYYLIILKSNFTGNLGSGGVFFLKDFKVFSWIWLVDIIFTENKASYGTLFNMDDQAKNRSIYCENCFIKKNLGDIYGMLYVYSIEKVLLHNITFVNSQFIENDSIGGTVADIWIYSSRNTHNNYYNVSFLRNIVNDGWGYALFSFYTLETWIFLTVRNCLFEGNTAVAATIYILFYTIFTDIGSVYIDNHASDTSSILYALYRVQARMENVYVEGSYASYGLFLFANDEAEIFLSNVTLVKPEAKFNIFAVASFVSLHLQNFVIKEPILPSSGCIFEFKNNGDFLQKIINFTVISPPSITIIFSEKTKIIIENPVYPTSNEVLFKLSFSEMNMSNAFFSGSYCGTSSKGCFIKALDSTLVFENFKMTNLTCSSCLGLLFLERTDLTLSKSNIFEIKNPPNVAILFAKVSNLIKISSSSFTSNTNAVFYGKETALSILDSKILAVGSAAEDFSMITCEECNGVNATNSLFSNAQSTKGAGAITLISQSKDAISVITNSSFSKLQGEKGGAIHSEQSRVRILNSKFFNNKAVQGGALYFFCSGTSDEDCGLEYFNNSFNSNVADIDGGAVKWLYKAPIEKTNVYENNTAITGNRTSNYPIRFRFRIYRHESDESLQAKFKNLSNNTLTFFKWKKIRERELLYDSFSNNSFYFLESQPPSQSSAVDFQFSIVDTNNQELKHDINAKIECSLLKNFSFSSKGKPFKVDETSRENGTNVYEKSEPKISGTLSVYQDTDNKLIMFENINFNTHPSNLLYLNFSSSSVLTMSNATFNGFTTQHPNEIIDEERKSYYLVIPVLVAGCKMGELYKNDTGSCYRCPANSYAFSIYEEDCLNCPFNAECLGGADIKVAAGYWRSGYQSLDIYKCNKMLENCLGGIYSECAPNMDGVLCGKCVDSSKSGPSFQKTFDGKCVECINKGSLVFLYLLFWICFSSLLYLISYYMTKRDIEAELKIIFRVWVNYFQVGLLMQSYNINVGLFMKEFDAGEKILSVVARVWFTIECVVQTSSNRNDFHLQSVVVSAVMYSSIILLIIMIKIRNRKDSQTSHLKERILLCSYVIQPFYMDFLANNLSCVEIEGNMRIRNMPDELCYTSNYYLWFFFFYMPSLIFWGIIVTYLMVKEVKNFNRRQKVYSMNSENMEVSKPSTIQAQAKGVIRMNYMDEGNGGTVKNETPPPVLEEENAMFLWVGYKKSLNVYIWEIINWINEQTRYFIVFYIVSQYIVYQTIYNPYQKRLHNWLEKMAKYSMIFIAQTLLMLSFDLDVRLYHFSMSLSLLIQFFFTLFSLILSLRNKLVQISWLRKLIPLDSRK